MINSAAPRIEDHDYTDNSVSIYSKSVTADQIDEQKVTRISEKELINNVVSSLKEIGKSKKIDEFDLKDNCIEWINAILNRDELSEKYLKFLLNDFTGDMMTRMRESDKSAIAILTNDYLLLCHAKKGEKTITPIYQVVDRMLDKDNVDRFVIFQKGKEDTINVIYYEHSKSVFFTRWLGIPDKDAYYYNGGENRIFGQIDGYKVVLELTDEDIDSKLLKGEGNIKIKDNQIIFDTQISRLPISQIRSGKKHYTKISQFYQDYLGRRYQLTYYQDRYKEIIQSVDPLFYPYYDYEYKLIKYEEDHEKIIVRKRNPNIHILFCGSIVSNDQIIEIDTDYLDQLYANFENNVPTRIFHAGVDLHLYDSEPFKIGPLEIFNNITQNDCVNKILDCIKENSIADKLILDSLNYVAFKILAEVNKNMPIAYIFEKIGSKICENIEKAPKIIQNEGEIVEFKSASIFEGKDDEIATKLIDDISKKIKENPYKVYIIGVEDDTKQVTPLQSRRVNSERLGHIKQIITKVHHNTEIWPIKVPINNNECIIIMIVCEP